MIAKRNFNWDDSLVEDIRPGAYIEWTFPIKGDLTETLTEYVRFLSLDKNSQPWKMYIDFGIRVGSKDTFPGDDYSVYYPQAVTMDFLSGLGF